MANAGLAPASGAQLAWSAEGDGAPLLLLHAAIADQRMWEPVTARLRTAHMVVRYDMRGFGRSWCEPGAFFPAHDAAAVMDALDMPSVHLVGCSFGGSIALELAVSHAERVLSLTIFAAPHPSIEWPQDLDAYASAEETALAARRIDEAVELNMSTWVDHARGRPDYAAMRELAADMQRRAFELQAASPIEPRESVELSDQALKSIACPTQILIGTLDHPHFTRSAQRLASDIPPARLRRVSGAGHLVPLEQPNVAAAAIAETVAEQTPSPQRRKPPPKERLS